MNRATLCAAYLICSFFNVSTTAAEARKAIETPAAKMTRTAPARMRNGLPPTSLDSFVTESGSNAEQIYGDEGIGYGDKNRFEISPYYGFGPEHRIAAGFKGTTFTGLTTGHGSVMPSAWGRDEFLGGEYSQSAPTNSVNPATQSIATDAATPGSSSGF